MAAAHAKAKKDNLPPRDAWMMECVQEDPSNPQPCSLADMKAFPGGQMPEAPAPPGGAAPAGDDTNPDLADAGCNPDFDDCTDAGKKK